MKTLTFFCIVLVGTGCYAHRGHAVDASASQWMAWADDACARNDTKAARTLLERGLEKSDNPEDIALFQTRLKAPCGKDAP